MLKTLFPEIHRLFQKLRRKIRFYLAAEGISLWIFQMGLLFWASLILDRFFEPAREIRLIFLIFAAFLAIRQLGKLVLLPVFRPISNHSLAILLEKRFPQFNDSLLTLVEPESSAAASSENSESDFQSTAAHSHGLPAQREKLLRQIRDELLPEIEHFRFQPLFRFRPLIIGLLGAMLMLGALLGLTIKAPLFLNVWTDRFLKLSETPWPRIVQIEMDPIFQAGTLKIARGSDVQIRLRAGVEGSGYHLKDVLRTVYLTYRTEDGFRNRIAMERENESSSPSGEWADFSYSLRGVIKSFEFDVTAGDASARGFQVKVVDSPSLSLKLRLKYPQYSTLTSQTIQPGTVQSIPLGTEITLLGESTKPLESAELQISRKLPDFLSVLLPHLTPAFEKKLAQPPQKTQTVKLLPSPQNPHILEYPLGVLFSDAALSFCLSDSDGITSPSPIKLVLAMEEDQLPSLPVTPWGIGEAVTPNAQIPMKGKITDDYGLRAVGYDWKLERSNPETTQNQDKNKDKTIEFFPAGTHWFKKFDDPSSPPLEFTMNGSPETAMLLEPLGLRPGDKFQISMAANDRNDIFITEKRTSYSQTISLEIVTPEQLRWKLEGREAVLSQLFDKILQEIQDSRESLENFDFASMNTAQSNVTKTEEKPANSETEDSPQALFSYRTERIIQNNRKNSHEFNGIAEGIENLCLQMVNNRIDTPSWFERLNEGIRLPLLEIHQNSIPELETTLISLRKAIDDGQIQQAQTVHSTASAQMDALILLLLTVREKMLKMQDFNEMVELLRTVIRQEEELQDEISRQNRSSLADLLFDDEEDDDEEEDDEDDERDEEKGIEESENEKGNESTENLKETELSEENREIDSSPQTKVNSKNLPESDSSQSTSPSNFPERQQEILRTFNLWNEKIPQMLEMLRNDPVQTELLKNARQQADESRILPRMEELVSRLLEKSYSQANDEAKSLISDLKKILEKLESENRNTQLANEMELLRTHLREINHRIRQQQSIEGRTRQMRDISELSREQENNAQKTGELARKIMDETEDNEILSENSPSNKENNALPNSDPNESKDHEKGASPSDDSQEEKYENPASAKKSLPESLRQAQKLMENARQKLEKSEREGALNAQKEALRELEEAKSNLEKILRQMREEETKRTLAQIEVQIQSMLQLQQMIYEDSKRLNRISKEDRTQEFRDDATRLSRREKEVIQKGETLLTILHENGRARMMAGILEETISDMRRVMDLLANALIDDLTLNLEADILAALEEMLSAVKETEKKMKDEDQENMESQMAETDQDPGLIDRIAELKMIRSAQIRIWKRTQTIGNLISKETTNTPEHLEILKDLSRQQQKIRKIVHEMAKENAL